MYCILWNYEVDSGNESTFEQEYGRNGSWFKFFEPCDDYLGHDLLKSTGGGSYSLLERWISKDTYEAFVKDNQAQYDELNGKFESLYSSETKVGTYDIIQ